MLTVIHTFTNPSVDDKTLHLGQSHLSRLHRICLQIPGGIFLWQGNCVYAHQLLSACLQSELRKRIDLKKKPTQYIPSLINSNQFNMKNRSGDIINKPWPAQGTVLILASVKVSRHINNLPGALAPSLWCGAKILQRLKMGLKSNGEQFKKTAFLAKS